MKKFIIKISYWFLFIFLIGCFICILKKYKFYGEYFIRQKINYYDQHKGAYNALILGSSRMYRQINPQLLDSLTSQKIKAYNLADGGTFFTESRYLFRQINIPNNIKYIFFEIQDLQPFDRNSYTEKIMYYHDFPTMYFEMKYFFEEQDTKSSFLSISHFFANIFYFKKLGQRDKIKNEFVNYNNGYFPLEKDYDEYKNIKKLRQDYLKDTIMVYNENINVEKEPTKKLNPILINEIKLIAKECKNKGIQLILILPPFAKPTELSEMKKIPDTKTLDFSSRTRLKELYKPENVYDIGHLSAKGSVVFTKKLADSLFNFIH